MKKQLLILSVVGLAVTAGCLTSSGPGQADLSRDVSYNWTTNANVTVFVEGDEYHMVADINNRDSVSLTLYSAFGQQSAVDISAIKFRLPNGTIVGAQAFSVNTTAEQTVIVFPADNGTFAFTANAGGRSVSIPAVFNGSYEVVLPEGMRIAFPVVGFATPGGYERTLVDDRVHLHWETVSADSIYVEYYFQRDLLLFGGLVGVLVSIALLGVVYYRLRIRRLEKNRNQEGLDLEHD